jgi:ABC-type glycerol-3-phosphate transport system permease component
MLEENLVLALLQTSVAGAGLVLAVYALVIPLWRRISRHRAKAEYRMYEKFKKQVAEVKQPSADQTYTLKTMLETIERYQNLPAYFSLSIMFTFISYIVSTFLSLAWISYLSYRDTIGQYLSFFFVLSTLFFMVVGIATIYLVAKALDLESEELKQKLKE